jgi:hypothetical protein
MKIKYSESYRNGFGGTVCKNLPEKKNTIFQIKVGSLACCLCEYFVIDDKEKMTVQCSFKPIPELLFTEGECPDCNGTGEQPKEEVIKPYQKLGLLLSTWALKGYIDSSNYSEAMKILEEEEKLWNTRQEGL